MSKRNVLKVSISIADLMNRCPREQKGYLVQFLANYKRYVNAVTSLPPGKTSIDWDYYRKHLGPEMVAMVDEFEKKYKEFEIPYPEMPPAIEEELKKQTDEVKKDIENYKAKSNKRIEELQTKMKRITDALPFEQMTMEDFAILYPDIGPDFLNRPTFWPHTPEEQLDYQPPDIKKKN